MPPDPIDHPHPDVERPAGSRKRVKFDDSIFCSVDNIEEFVLKKGMEFLDDEKRAEMEEKWKKLRVEELKLFASKQLFLQEQSALMLAALQEESHSVEEESSSEESSSEESSSESSSEESSSESSSEESSSEESSSEESSSEEEQELESCLSSSKFVTRD